MDLTSTNLAIGLLTMIAVYALIIYVAYVSRLRGLSRAIPMGPETEPTDRTLKQLRERFLAAYSGLDQVNTFPLIEKLLATTRMSESGLMQRMSINYSEQVLRIVPNLLIGGGLLGTFVGLTQNLSRLQNLIGSTGTIDTKALQPLLEGMSTAFYSSLAGLFYSLSLTILFSIRSPLAYRRRLVLALEHYLDNVVPTLDTTRTPTSKAIAELGQEFKGFLAEFAGTVQQSIDAALRAKLGQIFETNAQLQQQAADVYRHLDMGSTRLLAGASRFEDAVDSLNMNDFATVLSQATARLQGGSQSLTQSAKDLADSFKASSTQLTRAVELTAQAEQHLKQMGSTVDQATKAQSAVVEDMRLGMTHLTTASDRLKILCDASEYTQNQQQSQAEQLAALIEQLRNSLESDGEYRNEMFMLMQRIKESLDMSNDALDSSLNMLVNESKKVASSIDSKIEQVGLSASAQIKEELGAKIEKLSVKIDKYSQRLETSNIPIESLGTLERPIPLVRLKEEFRPKNSVCVRDVTDSQTDSRFSRSEFLKLIPCSLADATYLIFEDQGSNWLVPNFHSNRFTQLMILLRMDKCPAFVIRQGDIDSLSLIRPAKVSRNPNNIWFIFEKGLIG